MSEHYHDCWLAHHGLMEHGDPMPACNGQQLVRIHLIPRQLLKREGLNETDPATWVLGCGGIRGNTGHHGMLDGSRTLRIPYEELPAETLEFAFRNGLLWWLAREYER